MARVTWVLALSLSGALAAQRTWVVDDDGGPEVDSTSKANLVH